MRLAVPIVIALSFAACSSDPKVTSKKYLENGNAYFAKEKYKLARIMYKNALQKNQRYGDAYYQLALTDLRLNDPVSAWRNLQRAVELLPKNGPASMDSKLKLADLNLIFGQNPKSKQLVTDADNIAMEFLARDRNSFDGHRLKGDVNFVNAVYQFRGDVDKAKTTLANAIQEYRRADQIRPGQSAVQLALARTLAADGQFEDSEKLYKTLLSKEKNATSVYLELMRLYLSRNRIPDAENTLKSAIAASPKQYGLQINLAEFYYRTNRRNEMLKVIDGLKSQTRDIPNAYAVIGDFYVRLGDPEEAIRQYRQGMKETPSKKPDYQKRIIETLLRQGKREEAAQVNAEILKDNPKDPEARGMQASMLLDKGEVAKAITELQSVVTAKPDNIIARFNLGRAHMAKGELEQARQQFSEVVKMRPDYVPARLALSQLQLTRGDFQAAQSSTSDILALDRQNGAALLMQATALMGLKKNAEARQLLTELLKANPNSADVLLQLGALSLMEAKYKDAEDYFRKAYQAKPESAEALAGIVRTYSAQGKIAQAVPILQAERDKYPKRTDIRMVLANTAATAKMYDVALSEYQAMLPLVDSANKKGQARVYFLIGEVYRAKQDYANGIATLRKAMELVPNNPPVMDSLALMMQSNGQQEEARKMYEQSIKLDPENEITLNNLAYLLAETGGNLDVALTYAQRAKQKSPQLLEISDTLGWIYLKKNLSDNAVEIFQTLVSKSPDNSSFHYHLGMALYQKGDKAKALKELQAALQTKPDKIEEQKIRDLIGKISS